MWCQRYEGGDGVKFRFNKKTVILTGLIITVLGAWMTGMLHDIYMLIFHGKWPSIGDTGIALGSILMSVGPWIIKGGKLLRSD